jgi:hypothetical protein
MEAGNEDRAHRNLHSRRLEGSPVLSRRDRGRPLWLRVRRPTYHLPAAPPKSDQFANSPANQSGDPLCQGHDRPPPATLAAAPTRQEIPQQHPHDVSSRLRPRVYGVEPRDRIRRRERYRRWHPDMTLRWRKTDSNHRSLSGRIPLIRLVLPAGGVEEACSEKPPVLGGTGSSNPSSSGDESAAKPESLDQAVLISGVPK